MEATESDIDSPEQALERLETDLETLEATLAGADLSPAQRRQLFESLVGQVQDVLAETNGGHLEINTHSGGQITPLEPDSAAITLEDITHALSNLSRFTGQGTGFYSVARHAIHVSREVEARGGSLEAQRWGLLHDASEAYFADVPAPVKQSLPGYTHAEKRFQDAVIDAFDLALKDDDSDLVNTIDSAVGRFELAMHFGDEQFDRPTLAVEPSDLELSEVKPAFLSRAQTLGICSASDTSC
ncbi:hypothetical protein B2G88_14925 [Natronolimnobius baerhuensis]|uniref:Phosphohydrolase n=1 Tax=Natronolimnobius baerhuensis TaxID=253108 RepID=A0A202E6C3_9EURY|nr:hypothetical protein B2G88_14925 [Natronolimnobius baerhuensis]